MATQASIRVYTVVKVWRGMAVEAKPFRSLVTAQRFMRKLQRKYNEMEEDIKLFEGTV